MNYTYYKSATQHLERPFAFIDMGLFHKNIDMSLQRAGKKNIRIATKSVRCKGLLKKLLEYNSQLQGLMCYTALEAVWLSQEGFDDLLVAYPTYDKRHIEAVAREVKKGKRIVLMADLVEHLERVNKVGQKMNVRLPICMDIDMSSVYPAIHFGVKRSSICKVQDAEFFLKKAKECSHIDLVAIMGYEAQIAGLGDNVKGQSVMNMIIRFLKKRSIKEIAKRRKEIVNLTTSMGFELQYINGGGTGSLESTREEDVVTEVTVGSGFYAPTLFDSYSNFTPHPAVGFAIEIVRKPETTIFTCLGGGYVASGAAGKDKIPMPFLPKGAKLMDNEMAGEVQTPIVYKGSEELKLGDSIFMRHSKAGELCEHFLNLQVISEGKVIGKLKTYRGEGQLFL